MAQARPLYWPVLCLGGLLTQWGAAALAERHQLLVADLQQHRVPPGPANVFHNGFLIHSRVLYPMSLLWTVGARHLSACLEGLILCKM